MKHTKMGRGCVPCEPFEVGLRQPPQASEMSTRLLRFLVVTTQDERRAHRVVCLARVSFLVVLSVPFSYPYAPTRVSSFLIWFCASFLSRSLSVLTRLAPAPCISVRASVCPSVCHNR